MKVEGLERLQERMRQKVAEKLVSPDASHGESVVVGYTASYAVYVHENLEAAHGQMYNAKHADQMTMSRALKKAKVKEANPWHDRGPNQQAKFLEQPARELNNSGELAKDVGDAMRSGAKLQDALLVAAERIQRESQLLVPVDTGNLKQSAFVQRE